MLKKHRLKRDIEIDLNVVIGTGVYMEHPFNEKLTTTGLEIISIEKQFRWLAF